MKYLPLLLLLCGCTNTGLRISHQQIVPYALVINGQTNIFWGTNNVVDSFSRASLMQKVQLGDLTIASNTLALKNYSNDGGAAAMALVADQLKSLAEILKTVRPTP